MATPICVLLNVLPRELRDMIYKEVLADGTVEIDVRQNYETKGSVVHREGYSATATTPPLLRACRQIRVEASKMYYSRNVFKILTSPDTITMPAKWLRSIRPKYRRILKQVDIHFTVDLRTALPTSWIHEGDTHTMPRWAVDKQRQQLMQLVEDVCTMRCFKREVVSIQLAEVLACRGWCYTLDDLQSFLGTYGISGRLTSCAYCDFGSGFEEELQKERKDS